MSRTTIPDFPRDSVGCQFHVTERILVFGSTFSETVCDDELSFVGHVDVRGAVAFDRAAASAGRLPDCWAAGQDQWSHRRVPSWTVSGMKAGYARISPSEQDLTVQRNAMLAFGVDEEHIFVDHGSTGKNRARPGLREAMAAVRAGDTLVVSKRDRLAWSLPDSRDIADELTAKAVSLSLGGSTDDPAEPFARLLCNVLGMVAEFEVDPNDTGIGPPRVTPARGRCARRRRASTG